MPGPRPFKAILCNGYRDEIWTRRYSTKEAALAKAVPKMIQDCAPGCTLSIIRAEDGKWLADAKLMVGAKITIQWEE